MWTFKLGTLTFKNIRWLIFIFFKEWRVSNKKLANNRPGQSAKKENLWITQPWADPVTSPDETFLNIRVYIWLSEYAEICVRDRYISDNKST